MHWIDAIAKALLKRGRKHVVASGISISGHIHLGHAKEVFIVDAICRSLRECGAEGEAIWFADDFDPLRKIPWPLNQGELAERYEEYMGVPYVNIPSPDPAFKNFVEYFTRPFLDSVKDFGLEVKVYSGAEVYRSGQIAELIEAALKRADVIRSILNEFRDVPLPKGWLPFDPLCQSCGKIATTKALSWHGDLVEYKCVGTEKIPGCGYEGESDYTRGEGKLTWRVEWPARWKLLGVTCEPFGKDHAVVGGSYDTGKLISEEVFGYGAPHPLPYEWLSLRGERMSSSEGIIFTLPQWLEIAEPELLRFFVFQSKPMKAKGFDPGVQVLDLYDEFDFTEEVYFKKSGASPSKVAQLSRIYELSRIGRIPDRAPQRVSFRFAAVLCQAVKGDREKAVEILTKRKVFVDPSPSDVELAMRRLELAGKWVERYAPPELRFTISETLPAGIKEKLTAEQKEGLKELARSLSERDFSPIELHNHIYDIAKKIDLEPAKLFQAIYLVLLGRSSGPRAGTFISALDRGFVTERFREATI